MNAMNQTSPLKIDLDRLLRSTAPEQAPTEERPSLQPVPASAAKRRSPLLGALTAVSIVLVILMVQLGLSIAVSEGAYELRALETEQRDLGRVERLLTQNVEKLASPQNLSENAAKLGMVQNAQPASLRLSDGAILGSLEARTAAPQDNLVPNSTLATMPVVDADGLLVSRTPAAPIDQKPVRWEGKLPAPETR